ncbi:MAG: hypothetical protein PUK70_00170 [Bacteroidales bacterium]|nr:hypothetical protein [Bacteroidales bacterium]MDY6002698.1 hypothetical protein [Candidatus Cryptobacteroides sp.]
MLRWKKYALVVMVFALLGTNIMAQQMTLEEAIATARELLHAELFSCLGRFGL